LTITSRQNPIVARFRDAARGDGGGAILLDGVHLVADAVRAGLGLQIAAVTPATVEKGGLQETISALGHAGVEVTLVSTTVMDAISPVKSPSAIVALADRPVFQIEQLYRSDAAFVVVIVDVQDPGNVGAIVRVAEAAGATGVVAAGASANPFGWKALRGSMGSALRLPIVAGITAEEAVAEGRRRGCRIVAAEPRNGRSVFDVDLLAATTLLIGGEGRGLAAELIDGADDRITVPMEAPVESLNAAVTAALILYEARRQRTAKTTTKDTKRHETHETQGLR
jgi:TrmH family RNA methyltransferase